MDIPRLCSVVTDITNIQRNPHWFLKSFQIISFYFLLAKVPTFSRAGFADANMAAVQVVVDTDRLRCGSRGEHVLFHTVRLLAANIPFIHGSLREYTSISQGSTCLDPLPMSFWHNLHFAPVIEQGWFGQVGGNCDNFPIFFFLSFLSLYLPSYYDIFNKVIRFAQNVVCSETVWNHASEDYLGPRSKSQSQLSILESCNLPKQ